MSLKVEYSDKNPPLVAAVAAKFLGVALTFKVGKSSDKAPLLSNADTGFAVAGDLAIARYLVRNAGQDALLGAGVEQATEVDQFVDFFATAFGTNPSVGASALDAALVSRTYLAGFSLTLADIVAAVVLGEHPASHAGLSTLTRYLALVNALVPVGATKSLKRFTAGAALSGKKGGKGGKGAKGGAAAGKGGKGGKAPAGGKGEGAGKGGKGKGGGKGGPKDAAAAPAAAAAGGGGKKGKGGPKVSKSGKKKKAPPIIVNKRVSLPALPDAVQGQVVTRFPPEPSGYLHVGHIKAAMLNSFYAAHYGGKLLVRFDDTNPRKEKAEYEEAIIEDLSALGIIPDMVSHTSDHFELIITYARKMLHQGNAYMDDSTSDEMYAQRQEFTASPRRECSVAENLERFNAMLTKKEGGRGWCMRAKLDYTSKNKCCMDPVMFRHVEEPHNRTGSKYMAYPTYDFACPIVDAVEGVTHAMRTTEYKDRDEQYAWIARLLEVREVHVVEFARMNFQFTALSKRQLAKLVDTGAVTGWNDPRFPTVRGVMRRGVTIESLREFILSQGASKRITDMEWDKLWATNKKAIDKVCPRFTAVSSASKVPLTLTGEGVPAATEFRTVPLHPKNADVGVKAVPFLGQVWLEGEDAGMIAEGEEVTLMKWCNAVITTITKDGAGAITALQGTLNPSGDVRATSKKLTWVPDVAETVELTLREFDVLLTAERLEEGQDISSAFNTASILDTTATGEPALALAGKGDIIQLERRGYFIVDTPAGVDASGAPTPPVLFNIPSGKEKAMSKLSTGAVRTDHATLDARRAAATAKRLDGKEGKGWTKEGKKGGK